MRKTLTVAAIALVAGFVLAVALENVAHHYGLGPAGDSTEAGPDGSTPPPAAPPGAAPGPPAHAQPMRARFVFDGDTIQLQADPPGEIVTSLARIPVRLIGVDTPEVESQLREELSECFGDEATEFLRGLLPDGAGVLVDRDRDGWDDFDRRLLYVWLEDGTFVNYELVAGGYGEAIRVWPNVAYWDLLSDAQAAAERAGLGLWGAC